MATTGWPNPNYGFSWVFFGFNLDNNVGSYLSMPEAGTVTAVSFNCAGLSGSGSGMQAQGCVWDTSGNLLGSGGAVSLPYRTQGAGPYAWQTSSGLSLAVSNGQTILIGWWRSPQSGAGDCMWGYGAGGTEWRGTTAGSSSAGSFAADANSNRQIGVYLTYTPSVTPPPTPGPTPTPLQPGLTPADLYELRRRKLLP